MVLKITSLLFLGFMLVSCNYRFFDLAEFPELRGARGVIPSEKITEDNFASIFETVIRPQCLSCHQPGGRAEDIPFVTYGDFFKTTELGEVIVEPGKAEDSLLYTTLLPRDGGKPPRMPPGGRTPVEASKLQAIRKWIENGAKEN